MIPVIQAVYAQLNGVHDVPVVQSPASSTQEYPFITYKLLPIDNTEKDRDDYTLEVSHWTKSANSSHVPVLQLADKSFQALIEFRYIDNHVQIFNTRPFMGHVPDPDTQIKRYDVRTTLKTYRRS
ncbi:hypothetical protein [Oceanobacillus kimchii]|uniref:hypothetical protein n=1 Tax=Oceanobacillus kimchii TaxID=746691 RepID=UPI003B02641F